MPTLCVIYKHRVNQWLRSLLRIASRVKWERAKIRRNRVLKEGERGTVANDVNRPQQRWRPRGSFKRNWLPWASGNTQTMSSMHELSLEYVKIKYVPVTSRLDG